MVEKIMKEIERRLANSKNKVFPYVDLEMKNGDEVSIEAPSNCEYGFKEYVILTDDNNVIHFQSLNAVATWIHKKYH